MDASGNHDDAGTPDDAFRKALADHDFRTAVDVLMRTHGTGVYRFCLDLLRDRDAAQDALQRVFLHAYEALPRGEPRPAERAWLFGIARHRCMDALEQGRLRLQVVKPEPTRPEPPDLAEGGEGALLRSEPQEALKACLDALPEAARELIHLRYSAQLSCDEIAELVGEQAGTLRVRLARALPLLRECLERRGLAA